MKKIILIIYIALPIFLLNNRISSAQTDRTPIYVHGLGDNSSQWAGWQTLFSQERRISTGSNNSYNSINGISNFAGQVPNVTYNNTIFFGHSTGGVVARHIEQTRSNPFGGIITAGAPMDGARISNSLNSGQTANFIVDGSDKVLRGPIRQLGLAAAIVYAVAGHKLKSVAEDKVNDVLVRSQVSTTSNDLAEGSAYMNNGYRNNYTAMPKIHIYGNENSPVLWRIASTAFFQNFGSYVDFVDVTQQANSVYTANKWANIAAGVASVFGAPYYFWVADGWADGANWLNDGSERGWNDLIGSSIPASITTSAQSMDYNSFNQCMSNYSPATYDQYRQCQQQSLYTVYYTSYSPVNSLSDGFIKAPSQTGFYSAWSNGATRIEALGVNHLEMREHEVMRNIYNGVFDLSIPGVNSFFFTPRR